MGSRVLVAGASGALGRHLVPLLQTRGHTVRALARDPARVSALSPDETRVGDALKPETLRDVFDGVDVVFSSVGASVLPSWGDPRDYAHVDLPANLNLLEAAKRAGVRRFVYVSVAHPPSMAKLQYIRVHEEVAKAVLTSGLEAVILRPTGFFSALGELVAMARKGPVPLLGDGSAKSNPIHDADLAEHCANAVDGGPSELSVGGPEVLSRRQMAEAAFAALGLPPRFRTAPLAVGGAMGAMMRPLNPRLSHLVAFVVALSRTDATAPVGGTRKIGDYFKEVAARSR